MYRVPQHRGSSQLSRGIQRERQVRKLLEEQGWWVCRAAGSLGDADLVALRVDPYGCETQARLIEVKSTARGPYHGFGPKDRSDLLAASERAGAVAWLCWWPPRAEQKWIPSWEWPVHDSLEDGADDTTAGD